MSEDKPMIYEKIFEYNYPFNGNLYQKNSCKTYFQFLDGELNISIIENEGKNACHVNSILSTPQIIELRVFINQLTLPYHGKLSKQE